MSRRRTLTLVLATAVTVASAPFSRVARADAPPSAAACIDAHEQSQRLMQDGLLRAARGKLLVCTRETCPRVAQTDCSTWLREVTRDMPTVVVTAKDTEGHDTERVRVLVDEELLTERLDGRAVPLDPGPHVLRFELEGRVLEQKVLLAAGEQNRHVVADFTVIVTAAGPVRATVAASEEERAPPVAVYVMGGVAALSLASFAGFALAGKSQEQCVPLCTSGEVSSFRQSYLVADISLGVALVSAGAALYLALTRR